MVDGLKKRILDNIAKHVLNFVPPLLEPLRAQIDEQSLRITAADAGVSKLSVEIANASSEIAKAGSEFSKAGSEIAEAHSEIARLSTDLATARSAFATLEQRVTYLERCLGTAYLDDPKPGEDIRSKAIDSLLEIRLGSLEARMLAYIEETIGAAAAKPDFSKEPGEHSSPIQSRDPPRAG